MTEHDDPVGDRAEDDGVGAGGPEDGPEIDHEDWMGGGVEDSSEADEGFEIPVLDTTSVVGPAPGGQELQDAAAGQSAAARAGDWTRTESVRDDPGTLSEEARKLWDAVRDQFVDPLLRNYPEAAGHLSSAGLEFASAFRALVRGSEQRWTGKPPSEQTDDEPADWDGRIVIGEDGSETDNGTAGRPTE
jgi:Family of unknown function (DUF5304)